METQPSPSVPAPERPSRRPRLHLPFERRRSDAGEWAYDHRVGLCATLTLYLALAVAFVAGKIVLDVHPRAQTVYIDMQTLAELEAERDRLERETRQRQQAAADNVEWERIRNLVSNENASSDAAAAAGALASEPTGAAAAGLEASMRANRAAYEQGLAEERAIRSRRSEPSAGSESSGRRVAGPVTVRLDMREPVRSERFLEIPAYTCEGGGEVVVAVRADRTGDIVEARVLSGGDDSMREAALRAARMSRVNIDPDAPARQEGTITYIFIPQ